MQAALFDGNPYEPHDWEHAPFQRHSDTSREAAINILPKAGTKRRIVLDFITEQGDNGATDDEMQIALHMSGNTQRPRRVELWDAKLIKDSGRRRRTVSGEMAVVWICRDLAGVAASLTPTPPARTTQVTVMNDSEGGRSAPTSS